MHHIRLALRPHAVSYNDKSKTMSIRIDRGALDVLEWYAALQGVPLRTTVREYLQNWAEQISKDHPSLDLTSRPAPVNPASTAAALDELEVVVEEDRRTAFVTRLAEQLGQSIELLDALVIELADGTYSVDIEGVTFTDRPITTGATP